MRADNSPARDQPRPNLRVRTSTVDALLNAADWSTAQLSRRMCMDQSTVTRLLAGKLQPGPRSIASLLWAFKAFPKVKFENLFELFDASGQPDFEEEEPDEDEVEAISA